MTATNVHFLRVGIAHASDPDLGIGSCREIALSEVKPWAGTNRMDSTKLTRDAHVKRAALGLLTGVIVVLFAVQAPRPAAAQQTTGSFFDVDSNRYYWLNHIEGRQIGDVSSSTSAGATQYFYDDFGAWMFVGQGLSTNDGNGGANVGIVRRMWLTDDSIIGGGLWYDANQSRRGNWYQQAGYSFEVICNDWALRSNGYLPTGAQVRNIFDPFAGVGPDAGGGGFNPDRVSFRDNNIIVGSVGFRLDEVAMKGLDVELAHRVGNWNGEIFVGYYNLQGRIGGQTNGIKGGLRGFVTPNVAGSVSIGQDPVFGTNVFGGFTWFFDGPGGLAPLSLPDKLTIPVIRNQQVVVRDFYTRIDTERILTQAGQPILVMHINHSGVDGDGSIENPEGSLTFGDLNANKAIFDIVYVHSDTMFTGETFTITGNGQRFLGESATDPHLVAADQGTFVLPRATAGPGIRPELNGPGFLITLANQNEVSAFTINNATIGITGAPAALTSGTNINRIDFNKNALDVEILQSNETTIRNITSSGATGGSIHLGQVAGMTNLQNIGITDASGLGGITLDNVQGGAQTNLFNTMINGMAGSTNGFTTNNSDLSAGYDIRNLHIANLGGRGVSLDGGFYLFDTATSITDTGMAAFQVTGQTGVFFAGDITQNNNASTFAAINHTGPITFDVGMISATNGDGLQFNNANGTYNFFGATTLGGGDAGIDIIGSTGQFRFSDTAIIDPSGTAFNVDGGSANVTYSGGFIQQSNNATTINVQGGHTGTLNFGIDITAFDGNGLQFNNANGTYNFNTMTGATTLDSTLSGGDAGIDIINSSGQFTFANTAIIDPSGTAFNVDGGSAKVIYSGAFGGFIQQGNNATTINVQGGHTGTLNFGVDITATNGNGLQFNNADGTYNFNTMTGSIDLSGGDAGIDILNNSAGKFTFAGLTSINNASGGNGVNIDGGAGQTAQTTFSGGLDITTTGGGAGLFVSNSGLTTVNATGGTESINSTGGPAIDITGTQINMTFDTLASANSAAQGIVLNNVSGSITVDDGNFMTNNDVDIDNSTAAGIDILNSSMGTFTFSSVDIDTTGADGVLLNNAGAVNIGTLPNSGLSFIGGTAGDGIHSTNTNLDVEFAVFGSDNSSAANPITGDALDVVNNDGTNRMVTLINNTSLDTADVGGRGFALNSTSGTLTVIVAGNDLKSTNEAFEATSGNVADSMRLALQNNVWERGTAGFTTEAIGGVTGDEIFVTSLSNGGLGNTVIGNNVGGGMLFNCVTFDAVPGGAFDQVAGGTTQIGQDMANRVQGDGLSLLGISGDLSFATLNIFNNAGTGLEVDTKTKGTTFTLATGGGTINTTGGPAMFLDPLTVDMTLDSVTSTNSSGALGATSAQASGNGSGITLDTVAGTLNITSATVSGSNSDGILVTDSSADVTFGSIDIDNAGARGIELVNNTGSFNVTGITDIDGTGPNFEGIFVNGGSGNVKFDGNATIANQQGNGIAINGTSGMIDFNALTTINSALGKNAVSVESTTGGSVTFANVDIDHGGSMASVFLLNNNVAGVNINGGEIDNTGVGAAAAILSGNTPLTVNSVEIGQNSPINGIGIEINNTDGVTRTVALTNNTITTVGNAIDVENTGLGNLNLNVSGNTLNSGMGTGALIDGSMGFGTLFITGFDGNTVTNAATGGLLVETATFDADPGTAGIQQVAGGDTNIGNLMTTTNVTGDGLRLNQVLGDIAFGDLNIGNDNGTGLYIRDAGGKIGTFMFSNTGGTINTTNGTAMDIDPVTMNSTFASVSSSNANGQGSSLLGSGINLDTIAGSVTINGGSITGATGDSFRISGGTADVTYSGNITHTAAGQAAVSVTDHTGGTVTFDTGTIIATDGTGLQFNNADGTYNFLGTTTLNGDDAGIDIINDSAGMFTFDGLTQITNSNGLAVNIDGGVMGQSAQVTFNALDINQSVGAGVRANNTATVTIANGEIDNTSGAGVNATNAPVIVRNTIIGGTTPPAGAGIQIVNDDGKQRLYTLKNNTITSTGVGITTTDGGNVGDVNLILNGNTIDTPGSTLAMSIVGSALGSTNVLEFDGVTANTDGTGGGILFDQVTFGDRSGGQVQGGVANIGDVTAPNRVTGDGLSFLLPTGDLLFTTLNIANDGGTGLKVDTKTGGPTTFNLVVGGGSIDTTGGPATFLDPLTADLTFGSVTSTGSATNGVILDGVAGTVNIGTVNVTRADLAGLRVEDSSAVVTVNQLNVDGGEFVDEGNPGRVTDIGIDLLNNTGAVTISGGSIANISSDGVRSNNAVLGLNSTSFTNIGGFTANLTSSSVSGSGNTAVPFSCNNGGGNIGSISFNGGADTCP